MAQTMSYGFVWETEYRAGPVLINAANRVQNNGRLLPKIVNNYWVFDYSISDYGRYKVGKRSHVWQERLPRVGHLYPPRVPYTEDLRKAPRPIEDAWVIFTGGELAGLQKLIPKGYLYARFIDPEGLCLPLLQKAVRIGKDEGNAGFWKAQAVLCEIIGLLTSSKHIKNESYQIVPDSRKSGLSPWAESVQNYLRAQCARPIHLNEIARHFNVSLSTLCHRYRAETGEAPIATLIHLRIQQARNLLMKGQRLKTIADSLGFSDVYHLSKMFKRVEGRSPRQFMHALNAPAAQKRKR
ncbi:MAG: AraC family transcriptional regulator [Verrucomicrobiota bacterium]